MATKSFSLNCPNTKCASHNRDESLEAPEDSIIICGDCMGFLHNEPTPLTPEEIANLPT